MFSWVKSLFKSETEKTKQQMSLNRLKKVEVDGVAFYLKRLSAAYIISLQEINKKSALTEQNFFEMLSKSICDSKGNSIFSLDEVQQFDIYMLNMLVTEMMNFNGLNKDSVEKARSELKNMTAQG